MYVTAVQLGSAGLYVIIDKKLGSIFTTRFGVESVIHMSVSGLLSKVNTIQRAWHVTKFDCAIFGLGEPQGYPHF